MSFVRAHSLHSCRFPVDLRLLHEGSTGFLSRSVMLLARTRGLSDTEKATKQECSEEERAVGACGAIMALEASERQKPSHSWPGLEAG